MVGAGSARAALARASRRELLRHPGQTVLAVLGVALGVAVFVAVQLVNSSALRAFDLSMSALTGSATHRIVATTGTVPEALLPPLRIELGIRSATPVVETLVRLNGETFRLLGIDPFTDREIRAASRGFDEATFRNLLTRPGSLLLAEPDAARLALTPAPAGTPLSLQIDGEPQAALLVGTYTGATPAALEGLMLSDIATAQELAGRRGGLDRIELAPDPAELARLQAWLPAGLQLEPVGDDRAQRENMTRAFRINLTAMGLLALLVGVLLVYNTMSFTVLRRQPLFGLLRVLGATPGDLARLILRESLWFGLLGSVLGLLLGVLIGQGLIQLVTRTINDMYFVLTVQRLLISPWVLLLGLGLGVGSTLLAALAPARDAARTTPQAAAGRGSPVRPLGRALPWLLLAGSSLLVAGWVLSHQHGQSLALAFAGLFVLVAGYALLTPAGVLGLVRALGPGLGAVFGRTGRWVARAIPVGLGRTSIAVAALCVAVAATVGVGMMVQSLRTTVTVWLEQTLTSDIYVGVPESAHGDAARLPERLIADLTALPGVAAVSQARTGELALGEGTVRLLALNDAPQVAEGFRLQTQVLADPWPALRAGEAVLVSEALAYHQGLTAGDRLTLDTPAGPREFQVAAVFYDYSSDRGMLVMDLATYAAQWQRPGATNLGLRLAAEAELAGVLAAVRDRVATASQGLMVSAAGDVLAQSMAIFDRTFAITGVLRILTIGVAFVGIFNALLALQLERSREHATLRALGVTPWQLGGLVVLECLLLGLLAGLLALPLGWLMGEVLIGVVNRLSFGWSLLSTLSPRVLLDAVVLAVVAALLAGAYPAWRLARTPPATALREE